jgi:DNA polymerase III delta prime subunit
MFEVTALSEIKFDSTAFRNLVIPDERKALLQGLVEAHGRTSQFDDILATKGKGLVINLYGKGFPSAVESTISSLFVGPPGTGKTLTAEATSECQLLHFFSLSD